ncbi:adenylate/guanylate cyclase [Nitzschia inconspicua]|uniref:Adenylate/guanylate cyclase n=1 Tax=Nitzschia inconspicua TaxID=303405 RepID=A0A9K3KKX7_9STRA|nr:adenylate/guanylate cyclase [Nitzschia inconspicua]
MKLKSSTTSLEDEEFGLPKYNPEADDDEEFDPSTSQSRDDSSSSASLLGAAETRRVRITKLVFFLVLAAAATITGVLIFQYASSNQEQEFVVGFTGSADELIVISQLNMQYKFSSLESLAISMTTAGIQGKGSGDTWPFFTHPNFEVEAGNSRRKASSLMLFWSPLVNETDRIAWQEYSIEHQDWLQISYNTLGLVGITPPPIPECIFYNERPLEDESLEPNCDNSVNFETIPYFIPIWQTSPPMAEVTNYNGAKHELLIGTTVEVFATKEAILSQIYDVTNSSDPENSWENLPTSYMIQPVFETYDKTKIVGFLAALLPWNYFANILSVDGKGKGIFVFMDNPCGSNLTFYVQGPRVEWLGEGDLHDQRYNEYGVVANASAIQTMQGCPYTMHLYPSQEFESAYKDNSPWVFTIGAVMIYIVTALAFVFYDLFVEKRQKKVLATANQTGAIVNSMFPKGIRERLMDDQEANKDAQKEQHFGVPFIGSHQKTKVSGVSSSSTPLVLATKPIADYYPSSTLMVTDLVGFTAWSSEREPAQVFTLLETLFNAFDAIAKKKNIFKVETNGDCYVAAAGVPEPMKDHAVHMAKFALACQAKMKQVVQHLEVWLGPETGELSMRIGIHSGAVTAGVLRSDKGRFQLFGETVENTHIMEANSKKNKILVSQTTAELLKAAGKYNWLVPSNKTVKLKGSALEIQTFWLDRKSAKDTKVMDNSDAQSTSSRMTDFVADSRSNKSGNSTEEKSSRLVDWNVDILLRLLKMIVAMRSKDEVPSTATIDTHTNPLDEVKEIIALRNEAKKFHCNPESVVLSTSIVEQLHSFVQTIASMYNDNHFHNFAHACHVSQATIKLLSRIVTPDQIDTNTMTYTSQKNASTLHAYTYGITSDPMIQFSCAIAAMIHDVDHPGVSNATLVKEGADIAGMYGGKSCAEQNSFDLAWDLLMEDYYKDLRDCIYVNQEELNRFRQLLINSVMATDIVDKELGALRKARWNKAFSTEDFPEQEEESEIDAVHRKATIVIEHIVQAADVSHMMQHWHIYLKWNERFFRECYKAFLDGRMENDPTEGWYQGEMGFFDFYIIPLAKKLKDCGVFGVSSDEFLNYAMANRKEWELKGESIVKGYLQHFDNHQNLEQ